ncbi:unnamed protein product, partial [Polarella glacialis]
PPFLARGFLSILFLTPVDSMTASVISVHGGQSSCNIKRQCRMPTGQWHSAGYAVSSCTVAVKSAISETTEGQKTPRERPKHPTVDVQAKSVEQKRSTTASHVQAKPEASLAPTPLPQEADESNELLTGLGVEV